MCRHIQLITTQDLRPSIAICNPRTCVLKASLIALFMQAKSACQSALCKAEKAHFPLASKSTFPASFQKAHDGAFVQAKSEQQSALCKAQKARFCAFPKALFNALRKAHASAFCKAKSALQSAFCKAESTLSDLLSKSKKRAFFSNFCFATLTFHTCWRAS